MILQNDDCEPCEDIKSAVGPQCDHDNDHGGHPDPYCPPQRELPLGCVRSVASTPAEPSRLEYLITAIVS
jgi:hypothetical protein